MRQVSQFHWTVARQFITKYCYFLGFHVTNQLSVDTHTGSISPNKTFGTAGELSQAGYHNTQVITL